MKKLFNNPFLFFTVVLLSTMCPPFMIWLAIKWDAHEQEKAEADRLVREGRDRAFEDLERTQELFFMALEGAAREYQRVKDNPELEEYAFELQGAVGKGVFGLMSESGN